jgi:glycosyltransferase involved in cell wall biosynthesis
MSAHVRLVILDDGLFVRTPRGAVHPVAATFHRFAEAVVRAGPFGGRARYLMPVRQLGLDEAPPPLPAVDQAVLEVVPTAPFRGIADYVTRWPIQLARNWPPISSTIRDSDLVWLRTPASNALPALLAGELHGVPHFTWQAGSVGQVAAGQQRPAPLRALARLVGAGYDAVSAFSRRTGPSIELDGDLFASVVTLADVNASRQRRATKRKRAPWVVAWAGRMAPEKGLPELLEAARLLGEGGMPVRLVLIGDGPLRASLEERARALPPDAVIFTGFVGDREQYMATLRAADVFAHPSHAEGVPKALIDALAAGLPVVASSVGRVAELLDWGSRGRLVPPGDAPALAAALGELLADADARRALRDRGLEWAAAHTVDAQAERLVAWLGRHFPELFAG